MQENECTIEESSLTDYRVHLTEEPFINCIAIVCYNAHRCTKRAHKLLARHRYLLDQEQDYVLNKPIVNIMALYLNERCMDSHQPD